MKRYNHGMQQLYIFLVTFMLMTVPAYAASNLTVPSGMQNIVGSNGQASNSIFTIVFNIINDIVGAASVVGGAWVLFELYRGVIGFMRGGINAQKREEAKGHLLHVAIGAVLIGGAQLLIGALYSFGSGLK